MLYPLLYMLMTSFKSQLQYELGGGFSLSSWRILFGSQPVLRELLNSLIVSSCAAVMSVIPPIIVYLIFQRHLVRRITMGMGK
jgi:ABC-type glycerol-3-phosphate transport system permease component